MATVAHEGNPRTNSLAVTGTLDGVVYLLPLITPGPALPAPVDQPAQTVDAGNITKYDFSKDPLLNITFVYGNNIDEGLTIIDHFTGDEIDSTRVAPAGWMKEHSFRLSTNLAGMIKSGATCSYDIQVNNTGANYQREYRFNRTYWDLMQDQENDRGFPFATSASALMEVHLMEVSGEPISGVAVMVDPESTKEEFTGLCAVYDWSTTTLYTMSYNKEPLTLFGTVLSSTVASFPANGYLIVEVDHDYTAGNSFTVTAALQNSEGTQTDSTQATSVVSPFFAQDPEVAVIDIASSASHTAEDDEYVVWQDVGSNFEISDVL
jgi:hypothetical protein